jgi:hypothetical protein
MAQEGNIREDYSICGLEIPGAACYFQELVFLKYGLIV